MNSIMNIFEQYYKYTLLNRTLVPIKKKNWCHDFVSILCVYMTVINANALRVYTLQCQ